MLMALAALATAETKSDVCKIWPTNSGNVYVSAAARLLVLVIKFLLAGVSALVTMLTLTVAVEPLVFVQVNLSMIVDVIVSGTVYCVV
jgi:hypothetical protein